MTSRIRSWARESRLYRPYVRWKYRASPRARQSFFTGVFQQNVWGDETSRSGSGSSLGNTETLRMELPGFLRQLGARSLLDLPCGDWERMQHVDLSEIDTCIGGDIVDGLIADVRARHGRPGREFVQLDALSSDLPSVDVVMIRDLFGHLDHVQVGRVLRKVKKSGATWLLASHYPCLEANSDVDMGSWRPQNFTLAPYGWPQPEAMLRERPATERADKTLSAWRVTDL